MRGAEVDSELLFRLSAVLAAVGAPDRVVALKGNKPLEFRYSRRDRAVAYATDAGVLDDAIDASYSGAHDWHPMLVQPMTLLVFRHEDVFAPEAHPLSFVAQSRQRAIVTKGIAP